MIFLMTDSKGRQGGSSDIVTVGASDDISCIDSSSPSSTTAATPTSSAPSSTNSDSVPSESSSSGSSTPIGAIAGTVIGALIFLAVLVTLGLFFLRRKRTPQTSWERKNSPSFRRNSRRIRSEVDLIGDPDHYPNPHYAPPSNDSHTPATLSPAPYLPYADDNPFQTPTAESSTESQQLATSSSTREALLRAPSTHASMPSLEHEVEPFTSRHSSQSSMSAAQRKAAMAGVSAYKPSRYIVHTDLEDTLPPVNEDGVVELPPQYSVRHAPQSVNASHSQSPYSPSSSSPPPPPHTAPSTDQNHTP